MTTGLLSLVFAGFVALAACTDTMHPELIDMAPIRTIDVEVPVDARPSLVSRLEAYAQQQGFRFAARSDHVPELGESFMFELRRRDIIILGANAVNDPPPDAMGRGAAYSATRFRVSFYSGDQEASPEQRDALMDEVIELIDDTDEVDVRFEGSQ